MKKFRLLAMFLAILTLFVQCFACGGTDDNSSSGGSSSIKITVQDSGYGIKWVEDMGAAFEEKTGTKVVVTETYDTQTEFARLQLDNHEADIIFISGDFYSYAEEGHLYDITSSVYNKTPLGEEGKTIKEICAYTNAMKVNGEEKFYYVPFASGYVGMLYNETTLNSLFGESGWKLPNTTDELISILDDIKNDHSSEAYGIVGVSDYLTMLTPVWWAQYDTDETFFDYWRGYSNGSFCYDSPEMAKTQGRLEALKVLETIVKKTNGYIHQDSGTFFSSDKFKEGQRTVVGKGYGTDTRKVAFYPCGDWFENEMGSSLMAGQSVKMMKMPIISSIKNTFEDNTDKNMSDETLSSIITKIDSNVAYSQTEYGCAKSTFERVKEARNYVSTYGVLQQGCIPKSSKETEKASEFLRFIASKEGQIIFSKATNGLTSPYGYKATTADGVKLGTLAQSVSEIMSDETIYIYRDISQVLTNRGGLADFTTNLNKYHIPLFKGDSNAQNIFDDTYNTLNSKWSTYLSDAGISK